MAREPANSVPKRLATISTGSCADTVLIVAAGSANIGHLRCCYQKSTSIVRRVPTGGRRNGKKPADKDRKSVVSGKMTNVRVNLGGRRSMYAQKRVSQNVAPQKNNETIKT